MNIRTMQVQERPLPDSADPVDFWNLPPHPVEVLSENCGGGSCTSTWVRVCMYVCTHTHTHTHAHTHTHTLTHSLCLSHALFRFSVP